MLIMGSTQDGKSTLIEHIRSYANSEYAIDESVLGDGITSKTDSTMPFLMKSNLPIYAAYQRNTEKQSTSTTLLPFTRRRALSRPYSFSPISDITLSLVQQDSNAPSQSMELRFMHTPGHNGTTGRDSEYAASITEKVISARFFNLTVLVISFKNSLTEEKRLALEYFTYDFCELHSRIILLHTHVNYTDIHSMNTTHHLDMTLKNRALSKIFRCHASDVLNDEEDI